MRQHIPTNERERLLESSEPLLTFGARDESRLQNQLDLVTSQTLKILKKKQNRLQKEFKSSVAQVDLQLKKIFTGKNSDLLKAIASQKRPNVTLEVDCVDATPPRPQVPDEPNFSLSAESALPPKKTLLAFTSDPSFNASRPFAFPVSFDQSGFNSSIRWAEVAFLEASVAVLGPACNRAKRTVGQLPNPLMVSVACYILNEVLKRDSKVRALWNLLRPTIFDSIYSPLRINSEVARDELPTQHRRIALTVANQVDFEQRRASSSSQASSFYETAHDFSDYRLWIEEVARLRRLNDVPSKRVEELKNLLRKSYHLLEVERHRTDRLWLQRVLTAWRRHTRFMSLFRNAVLAFISKNIQRRVERECFLRWRRSVLQDKLGRMSQIFSEHKRVDHINEQTHINTILQLRNQVTTLNEAKLLMEAEIEAQLLDLKEGHEMAEKALRAAYNRSVKYAHRYKTHSRRWERLAKTFRPAEVCPHVPKVLLALGVSLARQETDLSRPYHVTAFRMAIARKELSKFLLCWVNMMMAASPEGKVWVPREYIASESSSRGHSVAPGDVATKSKFMNATALLFLVRELQRFHDTQRPSTKQKRHEADTLFRASSSTSPDHPGDELKTALEETYRILSIYTCEGLYPCLLMHCCKPLFRLRPGASRAVNLKKIHLSDEGEYTISMLWILAALFTGFVHYHYSVQAFLALEWPHSLCCKNENKLQRSAKRSLGVIDVVPSTELANSLTQSANPPAEGSDTTLSPTANNSDAEARVNASSHSSISDLIAVTPLPTPDSSVLNTRTLPGPPPKTCEDASYVKGMADTNSDIEVYTGRKDADLPPINWENDVDGLLYDIGRTEEHEMRKRRRLRRKEEKFAATMQTTGDVALPRHKESASGPRSPIARGEQKTDYYSPKHLQKDRLLIASRNSCIEEVETHNMFASTVSMDSSDSVSTLQNNSESDDASVSFVSTDSDDETNTSGEARTVASLQGHRQSSGGRLFRRTLDGSPEAVRGQFSVKVPPPSVAFDVRTGKRKKKGFDNTLVLQSTGERTEARRLQRVEREGLHAFVKRTLVDRKRRQQWLGMARLVVSLITRLRLLDIDTRNKNTKSKCVQRTGIHSGGGFKDGKGTPSKHGSAPQTPVSQSTKVKSSPKPSAASPTTMVHIFPDGSVADAKQRMPSSNYHHQVGKRAHPTGRPNLTKGVLDDVTGRVSSRVEGSVRQQSLSPIAPSDSKQNSLKQLSSYESKCGEKTVMLKKCAGPALALADSARAVRSLIVEPNTALPRVPFRQGERSLLRSEWVLRNDSVGASERAGSSVRSSASERSIGTRRGFAARTLAPSPRLELPQGPLDPLIARPEIPYKARRSTKLYRFDLKDNKK